MKILKWTVVLVIVLVVVTILSAQIIINRPFVKERVRQYIEKSAGRPVSIGSLRIKIYGGLALDLRDFYIYEEDGKTVFAGLESLNIGLRFMPLLKRKIEMTGIRLNRLQIAFEDISVTGLDLKADNLSLENLQITGAPEGALTADAFAYRNNILSKIRASLVAEEGNVSLTDISAQYCGGTIKGVVSFSPLEEIIPFDLKANAAGIRIEDVLMANTGYANLSGEVNVVLIIKGKGFEWQSINDNLAGTADVSLKNAVFQGINLEETVIEAMNNPLLIQIFPGLKNRRPAAQHPLQETPKTDIASLDIKSSLGSGVCSIKELSGRADNIDVAGAGSVGFNGAANLNLQFILSRELTQILLGAAEGEEKKLPEYIPQRQGRLMFPAVITGNIAQPKIIPDFKEILASLAKGAIQITVSDKTGEDKTEMLTNILEDLFTGRQKEAK